MGILFSIAVIISLGIVVQCGLDEPVSRWILQVTTPAVGYSSCRSVLLRCIIGTTVVRVLKKSPDVHHVPLPFRPWTERRRGTRKKTDSRILEHVVEPAKREGQRLGHTRDPTPPHPTFCTTSHTPQTPAKSAHHCWIKKSFPFLGNPSTSIPSSIRNGKSLATKKRHRLDPGKPLLPPCSCIGT